MEARAITAVSLFSGAGGLDIGLERAGFQTVSAVDHDADCVATLCANQRAGLPLGDRRKHLDGTVLLAADIEGLEPEHLRPAGSGRGWVPDLMAGGPPPVSRSAVRARCCRWATRAASCSSTSSASPPASSRS